MDIFQYTIVCYVVDKQWPHKIIVEIFKAETCGLMTRIFGSTEWKEK
jgi:hypothetical protein